MEDIFIAHNPATTIKTGTISRGYYVKIAARIWAIS